MKLTIVIKSRMYPLNNSFNCVLLAWTKGLSAIILLYVGFTVQKTETTHGRYPLIKRLLTHKEHVTVPYSFPDGLSRTFSR